MAKKAAPKKSLSPRLHALIGALIFSVMAMAPVLPNPTTLKFGNNISGVGSDSYSFIFAMWINGYPEDGKVKSGNRDLISGYPNGRPLDSAIQITSGLAYRLSAFGISASFCYNLFIWLWFAAAYLCGFALAHFLGVSVWGAHFAGLAIGLNPYQVLQSVDHIDLAMTWPVLLDLLLIGHLVVKRQLWAAPALIFLTAASVYAHPYYLICLAIINAVPLVWALYLVVMRKWATKLSDWLWLGGGLVGAASIIFIWKSQFASTGGGGIEEVKRELEYLHIYSTQIWNFILPPHYSLPFAKFTTEFKTRQTSDLGSNLVENTLYPGLLVLLALPMLAWQASRTKNLRSWIRNNWGLTFFLSVLIVIPILSSLQPYIEIFGVAVPTPSRFIHSVLPQFRTISRFGYITSVGLALLFVLLADRTIKTRKAWMILCALLTIDLGYFHARFYSDTEKVPEVYKFLKESTPEETVIFEVPYMWGYLSRYWESFHHRRNFGIFDHADPNFMTMIQTAQMNLDQIMEFCRANKIDYLILHAQQNMNLPGRRFENDVDQTWIYFLFARYTYLIPVK